jgi:hypothetical protein
MVVHDVPPYQEEWSSGSPRTKFGGESMMHRVYGKDNTTGCESGKTTPRQILPARAARGGGGLGVVWTVAPAYAAAIVGFW